MSGYSVMMVLLVKVTSREGETHTVNTFTDYITQEAEDQRKILESITDSRFDCIFDTEVGYIATTQAKDEIEFRFGYNPETEKYVAYLVDHANEKYLDFFVVDLEATKENIVESLDKAHEYIKLNNL
jgi:hypothetical protein